MGIWPASLSHRRDDLCPLPPSCGTALEAVVSLVNKLESGRAPSTSARWLCGAPLTALAKLNRGVRPIAAREIIRRLVAKCLMARVKQSTQVLLAPLQMGVAVQDSAEAIKHTTRRLVLGHATPSSDPDWALLQVDISNALNLVSRYIFSAAILEHFPMLGPWVTWCCDTPSNLLFDGKVIFSRGQGVQQGDPLGTLLFCLVMRHVSLGVANIFSSTNTIAMALNTSYLDDCLFGHNLGTLTRVLEYLQSPTVQSLGLYLNMEKELDLSAESSTDTPHATSRYFLRARTIIRPQTTWCSNR
jgi:Reverse transcriptase (RNA-dependent DNA polymerase)